MIQKKVQEAENLSSLMRDTQERVRVLDKNLKTAIAIAAYKETINAIISCTAEHFNILQSAIITGKTQKFRVPRRVVICMVHFEAGVSMRDITRYVFGKKHPLPVFKAIKAHRELDMKIKYDREYKEAYDAVLEKVKSKLNEQ